MLKKRVIPVILLKNGFIVQSKKYSIHKNLGNPIAAIKRMSEWGADELIYIDISKENSFEDSREDLNNEHWVSIDDVYSGLSKNSFMPTCIMGGIRTFEDIENRLKQGADKVGVNTMLFESPEIVSRAVKNFGSQSIVANLDYRLNENGERITFINHGKAATGMNLLESAEWAEKYGCGEILLQAIDRDGASRGYDIEGIDLIVSRSSIPVIALGGAGKWGHFESALVETDVSAVAAANIFQFKDQSVFLAKKYLYNKGVNVRKPELFNLGEL